MTPLSPYLSDKLGRRATLFIGATITLAGVIMQVSCMSMEVFIGARVLGEMNIQEIFHDFNLASQLARA